MRVQIHCFSVKESIKLYHKKIKEEIQLTLKSNANSQGWMHVIKQRSGNNMCCDFEWVQVVERNKDGPLTSLCYLPLDLSVSVK